jgi:hypothetical protein
MGDTMILPLSTKNHIDSHYHAFRIPSTNQSEYESKLEPQQAYILPSTPLAKARNHEPQKVAPGGGFLKRRRKDMNHASQPTPYLAKA